MNKYSKQIQFLTFILFAVAASFLYFKFSNSIAHAQYTLPPNFKPDYSPDVPVKAGANGGADFTNYFLQLIAGGLIRIAGPVAIIIIAIAGFLATVSLGNPTMQTKAKKALSGAVIGLIIIILSWIIIQTVISFVLKTADNSNQGTPGSTTPQSQNPPASGQDKPADSGQNTTGQG